MVILRLSSFRLRFSSLFLIPLVVFVVVSVYSLEVFVHLFFLFKLAGYGDPECWFWIWIIPYDILEKPEEYTRDFMHSFWITFGHKILQKFERRIDYNSKYGLKSDPVLPLSELLKKDKIFSSFVKVDKSGEPREITIEDLQESVCDIQLIPNVPEGVKKVFDAAKRLHIFGYFEYYFFTISQHYAFLALESALRNRYSEIYSKPKKFVKLDIIIRGLIEKRIIPKGEAKIGSDLKGYFVKINEKRIDCPSPTYAKYIYYAVLSYNTKIKLPKEQRDMSRILKEYTVIYKKISKEIEDYLEKYIMDRKIRDKLRVMVWDKILKD